MACAANLLAAEGHYTPLPDGEYGHIDERILRRRGIMSRNPLIRRFPRDYLKQMMALRPATSQAALWEKRSSRTEIGKKRMFNMLYQIEVDMLRSRVVRQ
ncbi:hypothetical protein TWF730_011230 [Orbilia blumenaviensis]|uniref:Uncharacterized protein n=1 Tax=Orbilia blumenaviensis TaxID=1796055 RepID=A0AAV9UKI6_9PEZI